jgi:hypothetical protein
MAWITGTSPVMTALVESWFGALAIQFQERPGTVTFDQH